VGCGAVAYRHADHLRNVPAARVSIVYDPNRQNAERLVADFGIDAPIAGSLSDVWTHPGLDAVVISSPTPAHYEHVCAAFEAGLDVLCEKPLAKTRDEIMDLIRRRDQSGRLLSVAYQRRYKAGYQAAVRELRDNADFYGPLREVHLFVCERWQQSIGGTWRDSASVPAGYFGDAGSHQVDIVHYVTGRRAQSLFATSERRGSQVQIVTRVLATLEGGVGLAAHFVGDANHWREDIHFHCRDADLLMRSESVFRAKNNVIEEIRELPSEGNPVAAFVESVRSRRPTISPAECALPTHDWTAAVMCSLTAGGWVEVGE
jgi:predicted dehydrogenase